MRKLIWAAALGGGLYWASKQEGGISGVFGRVSDKVKKVQDSEKPLDTFQQEFLPQEHVALETASAYSALPEHPVAG